MRKRLESDQPTFRLIAKHHHQPRWRENSFWTGTRASYEEDPEFIISSELEVVNRNSKPTIVTGCYRTIGTPVVCNKISEWAVCNEPLLSDHRYIRFNIETTGRNNTQVSR